MNSANRFAPAALCGPGPALAAQPGQHDLRGVADLRSCSRWKPAERPAPSAPVAYVAAFARTTARGGVRKWHTRSTSTVRKVRPACASTRCWPAGATSSCCASPPSAARTRPSAHACSMPPTSPLCLTPRRAKRRACDQPRTCLIDASTAHRTHADWVFGLPELAPGSATCCARPGASPIPGATRRHSSCCCGPGRRRPRAARPAARRDVDHRLLGRRAQDDRAVRGPGAGPEARSSPRPCGLTSRTSTSLR